MAGKTTKFRDPRSTAWERAAGSFALRVTLPTGEPFEFTVDDAVRIDPDDIVTETIDHARRYAFYSSLCVEIEERLADARVDLARWTSDNTERVRAALRAASDRDKEPTETRVKQALAADDDHRKISDRIASLERDANRCGVVREALVHRRDMLRAVSAYRAPEGAPTVRSPRYSPKV